MICNLALLRSWSATEGIPDGTLCSRCDEPVCFRSVGRGFVKRLSCHERYELALLTCAIMLNQPIRSTHDQILSLVITELVACRVLDSIRRIENASKFRKFHASLYTLCFVEISDPTPESCRLLSAGSYGNTSTAVTCLDLMFHRLEASFNGQTFARHDDASSVQKIPNVQHRKAGLKLSSDEC